MGWLESCGAVKEAAVHAGRSDVVRKGVKILFWSCGTFETLMSESPAGSGNACLALWRAVRIFWSSGMTVIREWILEKDIEKPFLYCIVDPHLR